MAVRWAITSGNWDDTGTWNEGATLGVPHSGDTVYLNGYIVNARYSINIGSGTIRNDLFEETGRSGGRIRATASGSISVTANVYCTATMFDSTGFSAYSYGLGYSGHLVCEGSGVNIFSIGNFAVGGYNGTFEIGNNRLFALSTTRSITINGNIYAGSGGSIANQTLTALTVNGVLNCGNSTAITTLTATNIDLPNNNNLNGTTLICNGNITIGDSSYISFTTANFNNIDGVVTIGHNSRYSSTTHNFNGKLIQYYDDSLGIGGLTCGATTAFHFQNPNFQWKNLSEPRTLKYIILTDYDLSNTDQYPSPANVKKDVPYAWGELTGQYLPDYPPETVVLKDYVYDSGNMTGTLETISVQADYPNEDDVRFDVPFDFGNKSGKCHVPLPEDVREGVPVDVNAVGTLIPSSGGDRLRIADFGYYTRSTSITYIVDLTESDKPAFADCEEIVLRSLFPTLDLDNIPDKFFDDLFIQFLRYRLLVEYYRGISVNSKFTPSEPTTEIVNYANTKCEYWLNTANLFLQLWGEKYPNSVKRDRILL